jgi:hypothetical protein
MEATSMRKKDGPRGGGPGYVEIFLGKQRINASIACHACRTWAADLSIAIAMPVFIGRRGSNSLTPAAAETKRDAQAPPRSHTSK